MSYRTFVFESCSFDPTSWTASFSYSFDGTRQFYETIQFESSEAVIQQDVLERCLELAFLVVGTSYYKCFPTRELRYRDRHFTARQVALLNIVYRDGLSQFFFENNLTSDRFPTVSGEGDGPAPLHYSGQGVLSLQSGGKDSLLVGELLNQRRQPYRTWYMTSAEGYPKVIERLNNRRPRLAKRTLDRDGLEAAAQDGGLNGHVPITYIALCYALIDAVLHGENAVLAAIGREGNEPHAMIDSLPVNHQWSKTWEAEQLLADYVKNSIAPELVIGSPIRSLTELRIAELFEYVCWAPYANGFSSCNQANYTQGHQNTELAWCGRCAKCANTFLLFSPFVIPYELRRLFNGVDLFSAGDYGLEKLFRGLLGVGGELKPFECVGEIEELRTAYHMTQERYGDTACQLPFAVPDAQFDYQAEGPCQPTLRAYVPEDFTTLQPAPKL